MGEWLEKTSLNKYNVRYLLNEEVEPAMCTRGKSIPGRRTKKDKALGAENIWPCTRNKAGVAGVQKWESVCRMR